MNFNNILQRSWSKPYNISNEIHSIRCPNKPARMLSEQLADLTQPQRDRLSVLELRGHEYRLWLNYHPAIQSVRNAILAPGSRANDQQLDAGSD